MRSGHDDPEWLRKQPKRLQVLILAYDRILNDPEGKRLKEKQRAAGDRGAALLGRHLDKLESKRRR